MPRLAVATESGLALCESSDGDVQITARCLAGRNVTSVVADGSAILAGARDGIARSVDGGISWTDVNDGLTPTLVRWMAAHPSVPGKVFAGTEPAAICVSPEDGEQWRVCPEVAELRDQGGWFLPYSPEAGCVRGFAFHGSRAYGAVEVGGILRSDDFGDTWRLVEGTSGKGTLDQVESPMVHSDVHSVAGHPSSPDLLFAATNSGLYITADGGTTWRVSRAGSYCRAVWIDDGDPDRIILGPADGVSRNGLIEESQDGGISWQPVSEGLDLPWPHSMVERFLEVGRDIYAITSDGRAFVSNRGALTWRQILVDLPGITAVTAT